MSYLHRDIIVIKFLVTFLLAALCFNSLAALDSQLLRRLDIQRGLFSDEYQSLDIEEQPIIYILQENTTAITRGVAVMVADSGIPIVGQESLTALASELNKIGWVTILLPAPDTGFTQTIIQDDTTTDNESTLAVPLANTQTPEPSVPIANLDISRSAVTTIETQAFVKHEQQLIALLQAIQEKSQEYPGFLLVISQGTSAAWLSKIYAERSLATPDAFVVISPFWPDRKHNKSLPKWIANTPMPVLDLYNGSDNAWAKKTVAQREIEATKSLKLQYRQRELLGFNKYRQQSTYISKEIYGWTSHMGW